MWVLACSGEFALATAEVCRKAGDRDAAVAQLLVLDVAGVSFADSSFLSLLVQLRKPRSLLWQARGFPTSSARRAGAALRGWSRPLINDVRVSACVGKECQAGSAGAAL
ncbi:hypothetical protein [Streptomyces goshikiensis]|uniref:hypothetical protein n=1 Tax=Streptomyces goshikiensis TaxID=1942 RepID=UPI0039A4D0B5